MDRITLNDLRNLALLDEMPRLSIYLPTNPGSPEGQQDEIRLRNLADRGEQQLIEAGMRAAEARDMVQQVRALPAGFWNGRRQGLAVFIAEDTFLPLRIGKSFEEFVSVGPRFYLKPLLQLLLTDQSFLLLALSSNALRLYRGRRDVFERIVLPDLPSNREEALNIDSVDRGQQVRSVGRGVSSKENAIFHGQGGMPDSQKNDLQLFLTTAWRPLQAFLANERDPLLLAGVDSVVAAFEKLCSYENLMAAPLLGNFDRASDHELHQRASEHVTSYLDRYRLEQMDRYQSVVGKGMTSREMRDLIVAAQRGDIDTLFLDEARRQWGRFDPVSERLEVHDQHEPMDDELYDLLAVRTWLLKGSVFVLPTAKVPEPTGVAAIYRRGRVPKPATLATA
jgi:hypothetical protein